MNAAFVELGSMPTVTQLFAGKNSRSGCAQEQKLEEALSKIPLNDAQSIEKEWFKYKKGIVESLEFLVHKVSGPLSGRLQKIFAELPVDRLDDLLTTLVFQGIKENKHRVNQLCLSFLSYERMEEILKKKMGQTETLKGYAEKLGRIMPLPQGSPIKKSFLLEIKRMFSFILNFFPNLIHTFLIAFALYDVGKEPQTAWEASAMLDIYYKCIMIPAAILLLVKLCFPALGSLVYLVTAGVVVVSLIALVIYVKWLKPCPHVLPHCHNLTQDAKLGYLSPIVGRETEIQKLVSLFSTMNEHSTHHAILVGPSGVGKTEIVKGLAQKIASGDVPNCLKNKTVFVINTASLVQGGMWGYADQMNVILNRIKGHENEVIFFFDEIHAALKKNSTLSDFLKPILDRGKIHCIAATTTSEYNKYIRGSAQKPGDAAFGRRFERIDIQDMSHDDTKLVLQSLVQQSNRGAGMHESTLNVVIEKTNAAIAKMQNEEQKRHQPAFAVEVLTQALNQASSFLDEGFVLPELRDKKAKLNNLREGLKDRTDHLRPHTPEGKEYWKKIQTLEEELRRETAEAEKKQELIRVYKAHSSYLQTQKLYLSRQTLEVLKKSHSYQKVELKKWFFNIEYLLPQLEKVIEASKKEMMADGRFCIEVNEVSIDKIIAEMCQEEAGEDPP